MSYLGTAFDRIETEFYDIHTLGNRLGFELDFCQLSPGTNGVPTTILQGPHSIVIDLQLDCGFHQRGIAPAGTVAIGLPLRGVRFWCDRHYTANSILPFNLSSGINVVSQASFEAYVLVFCKKFLYEIAAENRLPLPEKLERPASADVIGDSMANQLLRKRLHHLMAIDSYQMDEDTEFELALSLLDAAQEQRRVGNLDNCATRSRAVETALDFIEAMLDEPLNVRDLSIATGIPARTLLRGFQERFGIGPKAYINQLRLSRVRKSLIRGAPATKISDFANQYGFWHMGQFARDYRRLFGELPSKTAQSSSSYATNSSLTLLPNRWTHLVDKG